MTPEHKNSETGQPGAIIWLDRHVLRVLPVNLYIEDTRLMFDTAPDAT